MSDRGMHTYAVGLAFLMALGCGIFIVWLVVSLARDLYRHVTSRAFRIKYADLNAHRITPKFNVGRSVK